MRTRSSRRATRAGYVRYSCQSGRRRSPRRLRPRAGRVDVSDQVLGGPGVVPEQRHVLSAWRPAVERVGPGGGFIGSRSLCLASGADDGREDPLVGLDAGLRRPIDVDRAVGKQPVTQVRASARECIRGAPTDLSKLGWTSSSPDKVDASPDPPGAAITTGAEPTNDTRRSQGGRDDRFHFRHLPTPIHEIYGPRRQPQRV
jgi:hypothetical protein